MQKSELDVITSHLNYADKQDIAGAVQEGSIGTSRIFANVTNFYLEKYQKLHILEKYKPITLSKGELKRIKGFEDTELCLKHLKNDGNPEVAQSATAVNELMVHLKSRQNTFKRGFMLEKFSLEILYDTLAATVIKSTSVLIGHSEYGYGYNKTSFDLFATTILTGIKYVNGLFKSGKVDDFARTALSAREPIREGLFDPISIVVGTFSMVGSAIISMIRGFVYWIMESQTKLADYLEQQALYLKLHENDIKNNPNFTEAQKKDIIKNQRKWSDRLLDLADTIQIEEVKNAKARAAEEKEDDVEMTKDKILDGQQPSTNGDINY